MTRLLRSVGSVPGAFALLALLVPFLSAQEEEQQQTPPPAEQQTGPPARQQPDTAQLVFEREVFVFPQYARRDPFVPLLTGDESGPRFEQIQLTGVIYSEDPNLSVALFGPRGIQGGEGVPLRAYRAHRGDKLGNIRILEIQPTRVVVEVEEFGLTEQRIMELQRPGQGGHS